MPFRHYLIIGLLLILGAAPAQALDGVQGPEPSLASLPELSLLIVEFAREHGRSNMDEAIRLTKGNRDTLKQHLRALVEQAHRSRHVAGRGVWHELR